MNLESVPHVDRFLQTLGLEQRRKAGDYVLSALGIFAVGVLVGGVLGLLFAPKAGSELRNDLNRGLEKAGLPSIDNGMFSRTPEKA